MNKLAYNLVVIVVLLTASLTVVHSQSLALQERVRLRSKSSAKSFHSRLRISRSTIRMKPTT
jgi:hypothetical protein